jgi:hypothetical protein
MLYIKVYFISDACYIIFLFFILFYRVKLTFGLNALIGKKNSMEDKKNYMGNWNPKNAISLMKHTISKGYKIDSYELGSY